MSFLMSLADFLSSLAFLCCHYIFDSSVTYLTLSFNNIYLYFHSYWFLVHTQSWTSLTLVAFKSILRILTEKKHPKVKLQRFWRVWIWTFGWLVHQMNSIYEVPKLKQNFRKRKVVTSKTPFFLIRQFCTPHSICLRFVFCLICLLTEQFCKEMLCCQS